MGLRLESLLDGVESVTDSVTLEVEYLYRHHSDGDDRRERLRLVRREVIQEHGKEDARPDDTEWAIAWCTVGT